MRLRKWKRVEVFHQTCSDIMVYALYRHSGIFNGVPLLILHNTPDAAMHLDREGGRGLLGCSHWPNISTLVE